MLRYKNRETLHPKKGTWGKQNGVHRKLLFEDLAARFQYHRSMCGTNHNLIPAVLFRRCSLEMEIDQYFLQPYPVWSY